MSNFIEVTILERAEGAPGVVEPEQIDICINADNITICNGNENVPEITMVMLTCGTSLYILESYDSFRKKLMGSGTAVDKKAVVPKPKPKPTRKRKVAKK